MKNIIIFILLSIFISSCGLQNEEVNSKNTNINTKNDLVKNEIEPIVDRVKEKSFKEKNK